jgi:hypothetical protein
MIPTHGFSKPHRVEINLPQAGNVEIDLFGEACVAVVLCETESNLVIAQQLGTDESVVDIRMFWQPNPGEPYIPTKKGVRLSAESEVIDDTIDCLGSVIFGLPNTIPLGGVNEN